MSVQKLFDQNYKYQRFQLVCALSAKGLYECMEDSNVNFMRSAQMTYDKEQETMTIVLTGKAMIVIFSMLDFLQLKDCIERKSSIGVTTKILNLEKYGSFRSSVVFRRR